MVNNLTIRGCYNVAGHIWSLLVTAGHSWSQLVTDGTDTYRVVLLGPWLLIGPLGVLVTPGHSWSQLVTKCSLVTGGHIGHTLFSG